MSREEPMVIAPLRLNIRQAGPALNLSRATIFQRIKDGRLRVTKDGAWAFVSHAEIARYLEACSSTTT